MSTSLKAAERTRRRIRQAFAELLGEYGRLGRITVTDLAERAGITRGTFYNYYNNIHEIAAELQSELEETLFARRGKLKTLDDIDAYLDEMFEFLAENEELYHELLQSDTASTFLKRLENEMNTQVLAVMSNLGIWSPKLKMDVLFLANGAISIVQQYYQGEVNLGLFEIRDYLKQTLRDILSRAWQ